MHLRSEQSQAFVCKKKTPVGLLSPRACPAHAQARWQLLAGTGTPGCRRAPAPHGVRPLGGACTAAAHRKAGPGRRPSVPTVPSATRARARLRQLRWERRLVPGRWEAAPTHSHSRAAREDALGLQAACARSSVPQDSLSVPSHWKTKFFPWSSTSTDRNFLPRGKCPP